MGLHSFVIWFAWCFKPYPIIHINFVAIVIRLAKVNFTLRAVSYAIFTIASKVDMEGHDSIFNNHDETTDGPVIGVDYLQFII